MIPAKSQDIWMDNVSKTQMLHMLDVLHPCIVVGKKYESWERGLHTHHMKLTFVQN
jgi:hypothetical protein